MHFNLSPGRINYGTVGNTRGILPLVMSPPLAMVNWNLFTAKIKEVPLVRAF